MKRNNTREKIIEAKRKTTETHHGFSVSVAKNHVNNSMHAPEKARKTENRRSDLNKGLSTNRENQLRSISIPDEPTAK